MIPWKLLDRAQVPGSDREFVLHQRGTEYSIRVAGNELMNSREYASEDALSTIGCERIVGRKKARVLIGGLGMGYSLATALAGLGKDATVEVAELVPSVVTWNRTIFGHLAGHPLRDRRVMLREADVASVLREHRDRYDAVLLDVDNGPNGLSRVSNDWLYGPAGLACARGALRKGGILGVWSARPDNAFVRRMRRVGFQVDEVLATSRGGHRGARHVIWLGARSD